LRLFEKTLALRSRKHPELKAKSQLEDRR